MLQWWCNNCPLMRNRTLGPHVTMIIQYHWPLIRTHTRSSCYNKNAIPLTSDEDQDPWSSCYNALQLTSDEDPHTWSSHYNKMPYFWPLMRTQTLGSHVTTIISYHWPLMRTQTIDSHVTTTMPNHWPLMRTKTFCPHVTTKINTIDLWWGPINLILMLQQLFNTTDLWWGLWPRPVLLLCVIILGHRAGVKGRRLGQVWMILQIIHKTSTTANMYSYWLYYQTNMLNCTWDRKTIFTKNNR